jgi:transcriptional antiterminator RfaH
MVWSVAQTQPFSERKAKRFLESQRFECYLPKILVRPNTHHTRKQEFALFARYIFVRIVDAWHAINSTPGISRMLLNERNEPVALRDTVIAELRSREDRNGFVILPKKEKYQIGQQVRVVSGQFAGQLALYDGMSSRQRERVLLGLLGQIVPVELNIDSRLEAVAV